MAVNSTTAAPFLLTYNVRIVLIFRVNDKVNNSWSLCCKPGTDEWFFSTRTKAVVNPRLELFFFSQSASAQIFVVHNLITEDIDQSPNCSFDRIDPFHDAFPLSQKCTQLLMSRSQHLSHMKIRRSRHTIPTLAREDSPSLVGTATIARTC